MKSKLKVITALSYDTDVLILDEPTVGLDVVVRDDILDEIREYMEKNEERTVIISSHISSDVEKLCDTITMIHDGKIVFIDRAVEIQIVFRHVLSQRGGVRILHTDDTFSDQGVHNKSAGNSHSAAVAGYVHHYVLCVAVLVLQALERIGKQFDCIVGVRCRFKALLIIPVDI